MASMQTIDGLRDALGDLEKQRDKAEEKYRVLLRREEAVRNALGELEAPQGEPEVPQTEPA